MRLETVGAAGGKLERLQAILRDLGRVAVGVSGGVDSGTLLAVAARALGRDDVLAVTASSAAEPPGEVDAAARLAESLDVAHVIVDVDWLNIEGIADNPPDRCYRCKRELFTRFRDVAAARGFDVLLEGGNTDDLGDYRPGARALEELGVRRPMIEAGMSKADVREIARALGLPFADRPALACLGSRFPYGARLSAEAFDAVGRAEAYLRSVVDGQVRVRAHEDGRIARIEVDPPAVATLIARRNDVVERLGALGFAFVALDLAGYRTGSQNATLPRGGGNSRAPERGDADG